MKLQQGFTTGSCLIAGIKTAYYLRNSKIDSKAKNISILFPDKKYREIKINNIKDNSISIIKFAGDDPDITNGIEFIITLSEQKDLSSLSDKDYLIESKNSKFILKGKEGLGFVTRKGLNAEYNKWAINCGPRKMLKLNLDDFLDETDNIFLIEIRIINGETIAKKTLNPTLGVIGGISILGNSGIVEPHSHKAYIKTISLQLKNLDKNKIKNIVFCTGVKTEANSIEKYNYSRESFIRIADFIGDALEKSSKYDFDKIVIACMPGKLFKYALGYKYTHAHTISADLAKIYPFLIEAGIKKEIAKKLSNSCKTVSELTTSLIQKDIDSVINILSKYAIENFKKWNPNCKEIELFI